MQGHSALLFFWSIADDSKKTVDIIHLKNYRYAKIITTDGILYS